MLNSRLFRLASLIHTHTQKRQFSSTKKLFSDHVFKYREIPEAPRGYVIAAEIQGAILWWWIFWHCMTDYGHVVGEFWDKYPDPSAWTDEELGIPPDSEELGLRED